jgi:hypothetical protein
LLLERHVDELYDNQKFENDSALEAGELPGETGEQALQSNSKLNQVRIFIFTCFSLFDDSKLYLFMNEIRLGDLSERSQEREKKEREKKERKE